MVSDVVQGLTDVSSNENLGNIKALSQLREKGLCIYLYKTLPPLRHHRVE
jgi:hypothetical protein